MKGFWHSFGTVGAQMESSEVGTFGEVLCFQTSSGATRRDRTGDLLITNQLEQVFWTLMVDVTD